MQVLLRKLDRELTDALSCIIAAIDSNYNLSLLVNGSPVVVTFWLDAFKHEAICDVEKYLSMTPTKPETGSEVRRFLVCQKPLFQCNFPFSDTIQVLLETKLKKFLSIPGKYSYYVPGVTT